MDVLVVEERQFDWVYRSVLSVRAIHVVLPPEREVVAVIDHRVAVDRYGTL